MPVVMQRMCIEVGMMTVVVFDAGSKSVFFAFCGCEEAAVGSVWG